MQEIGCSGCVKNFICFFYFVSRLIKHFLIKTVFSSHCLKPPCLCFLNVSQFFSNFNTTLLVDTFLIRINVNKNIANSSALNIKVTYTAELRDTEGATEKMKL